jgi:hypothetical protein
MQKATTGDKHFFGAVAEFLNQLDQACMLAEKKQASQSATRVWATDEARDRLASFIDRRPGEVDQPWNDGGGRRREVFRAFIAISRLHSLTWNRQLSMSVSARW